MLLNRFHLFMPIYVIIALTTSFVAYGQPPVKFKEKTGEKIEVPVDIVKIIKTMNSQIQDLGGYESLSVEGSEAIPIPELLPAAVFKKIIEILSAAKKTLGIDDLSKASEDDLQNAVEKNIKVASPNELLEILTVANFLEVKSILNDGAKIFAKNYSGIKSNFYSLIPEIKQLIIQNMSPGEFLALVKANPQGDNSPEEQELFKMALKIQAGATAPEGKTAKEFYEANWRAFGLMPRVGECYHLKVSPGGKDLFLTSSNNFSQTEKRARVCAVGNFSDKMGFKIDTDEGEKFLAAFPDGSVKLMSEFQPWETFSITGISYKEAYGLYKHLYKEAVPVIKIKTAHDTYLMAKCTYNFGRMMNEPDLGQGYYSCRWGQNKEAEGNIEYYFIEFVPIK